MRDSALVSSSDAAKRLGVGVTAVKRWAEAGALACVKTAGGHRRFRLSDIERFRRSGRDAEQKDVWREWIDALTESVNVHAVLSLLFAERAVRADWCDVAAHVGTLLVEIGDRWARNELTVAQEHVASATLARALALAAETLPVSVTANRCLLATAEGDDHTLGLSLAEICLREAGWRAEWAGNRTRPSDVCERVHAGKVKMVALSASAAMNDGRVLRTQVRVVGSACQRASIPLVLGGAGRWPDPPAFGTRLRGWSEFGAWIRDNSNG